MGLVFLAFYRVNYMVFLLRRNLFSAFRQVWIYCIKSPLLYDLMTQNKGNHDRHGVWNIIWLQVSFCPLLNLILAFLQAAKLQNLATICSTTEHVRGMGLFKLLCMHVYKDLLRYKSICDVKPGIDPYPLLARSWNRWWPDFVTFAGCKKVKI